MRAVLESPGNARDGQGNQAMKYNISGRGFALAACGTAAAAAFCFAVSAPATAGDQPPIKSSPAKGEFSNECAMGLASGQEVKTDCLVNWTAPDGKVYCFSTEGSKQAFLKDPDENIQKAREFFLAKDQSAQAAPTTAEIAGPVAKGPAKEFTEDDVNAAVKKTVDERSKDGVFVFHDPKLDEDLNLLFEQVKMVRGMEGYGWFANTIFHDKDEPKKQYAIDVWFKPEGQDLKLMDIRVQKGPKQEGDSYVMVTRMPVAWWWLPVQEHPGSMEVTRAWQVMS